VSSSLDRRLKAAEARRFGSARVAAMLRGFDSMSDRELGELIATGRSGICDLRMLTDRELDCLIVELQPVSCTLSEADLDRMTAEITEWWKAADSPQ